MKIEVVLTPAEIARLPQWDLSAATCVVFDVLRATSTMLTALAHGARRICPVSTVAEAWNLKRTTLPEALLGGERSGVRIEGFDLGNSPREYTAQAVAGRAIIVTTTNGTVALRACAAAKVVLAGAWLNLDALATWLLARPGTMENLVLVCAGTGEDFALEDGLAAGGLLARLSSGPVPTFVAGENDAATAMLALHDSAPLSNPLGVMRMSVNGRRLGEIGLGADVEDCAATTALPWVGVMREGVFEGEFVSVTG